MSTSNVIPLRTAARLGAATLTPAEALAQIAELLSFNGVMPSSPAEIVKLVASHVRANREHGRIIHDLTVGQQAAWIEWKHGEGAEAAMVWIENALAGPGLLPGACEDDIDADDPILRDAQGYSDRYSTWGGAQGGAQGDKAIRKTEAALRAAKNDAALLDFMDAQHVEIRIVDVPGADPAETVFEAVCNSVEPIMIGFGTTIRAALRTAIRATDPQGDLFGVPADLEMPGITD